MLLPLFNYATFFSSSLSFSIALPSFSFISSSYRYIFTSIYLSFILMDFFISHNGRNNIIFDFPFKHERFLWTITSFTRFHLCLAAAVKLRVERRRQKENYFMYVYMCVWMMWLVLWGFSLIFGSACRRNEGSEAHFHLPFEILSGARHFFVHGWDCKDPKIIFFLWMSLLCSRLPMNR